MVPAKKNILVINGGSSSLKFAVYEVGTGLSQICSGGLQAIGGLNVTFSFEDLKTEEKKTVKIGAADHIESCNYLMSWFETQHHFGTCTAIGHRIVHGMKHTQPQLISTLLLEELKGFVAFDADHLPQEIRLVELFIQHYPSVPQVACFDTSFHATMPPVAKLLAIPRKYTAKGIQRYGFHGLSYAYLIEELERAVGTNEGKVILAHLGSGASLAAVKDGKSMDTSMGFTPASGIPMSTRPGDLDPGVAAFLMQAEHMDALEFGNMIDHASGLLGISETSADMRELLVSAATDTRAAEAVELFCYQTKKWIGSFAVVLDGFDTLVFSGGIGENAPEIRKRICGGLRSLGVELDPVRNENNESVISVDGGRVCVRVIKTNEGLMIAKLVCSVLNYVINNG